jgi:phage terminase large subunit-like protein
MRNLVTRHEADAAGKGRDIIVSAEPTWTPPDWDPGHPDFTRWQTQIDTWGLPAFRSEAQHEVDAREGALWDRGQLTTLRRPADAAVDLVEVVVSIDPSGGSGPDNDAQGIIVAGRDHDGRAWVLADETVLMPPRGWGDAAVQAMVDWDADAFVAEVNYGGDMVVEVITGALERHHISTLASSTAKVTSNGRTVTIALTNGMRFKVHIVTASRGKAVRAQPVAALYGRPDEPDTWSTGRVHHAGVFEALEDEMVTWRAEANWSPNRLDALVWAVVYLLVDAAKAGRRRSIVAVGAA